MPSILALKRQRQRQEDLCEFQTSLVYRVSTRTPRATEKKTKHAKKASQAWCCTSVIPDMRRPVQEDV